MKSKASTDFFQVGGTLSEDAQSYVERLADQELLQALKGQALCLVLAPRQMGKSSLMVHAIAKLKSAGKRPGFVDLQLLGSQINLDYWFRDVVYQICSSLSLDIDILKWWQQDGRPGPTQRFVSFVEDVLLHEIDDEIIIFVDEIDSILSLPFSDEFFTSIRSLYNGRASSPELRRVTFVLLGVATASSFIKDRSRTPFNIGKAITLRDFDQKSIGAFQEVLGPDSDKLIDRIFYWTSGQPFLVQQLAAAAFSWSPAERTESRIDEEVRATYLDCKIEHDTHLKPIQDYLLATSSQTAKVLNLYRKVLTRKAVIEDVYSSVQSRLKLSGLVRTENKRLVVRNRIYENIFDSKWIKDHTGMPRWLLVILSQLPLLLGLRIWFAKVNAQPTSVAIACLIYELCVFAFILRDEIEYRSKAENREQLSRRTRTILSNYLSPFRQRYKRFIISKHEAVNTKGLGLINTFSIRLDQIFVNLRISYGNAQSFNTDPISKAKIAVGKSIWDFLRYSKNRAEVKVLAIIGPPGAGKTTLLQYVAIALAAGRHNRYHLEPLTPVLILIRDYVSVIVQDAPPSLGTLLQNHFEMASTSTVLRPPKGWFERELERGKGIILLDGLDEVADTQQRRVVSAWIDDQIASYPKCRFVITARPQGYMDAPLKQADVLEVQPFNQTQVQQFIENWYLANEIRASDNLFNDETKRRASEGAADLLTRLHAVPSLGALTVNPLLLTMIAMVHRYYGALPGSRVELYSAIFEVLLGKWRISKGVVDEVTAEQKLMILRSLASFMMDHKLRRVSVAQVATITQDSIYQLTKSSNRVQSFLDELQASSGLFLESESGYWSFAHLTFQEFLTADYWANQHTGPIEWAKLVRDGWWHETLRLYAAQHDASPIVRACLDNNDVSSLALAADCLKEARDLEPTLRRATELRLIDALESDDPGVRNYAAEVWLLRRLNSLQRIDENRLIDLGYITCAEYQIFITEIQQQGLYHQPQHWLNQTFASGEALNPVTGVTVDSAIAFCQWLTQRDGRNIIYRLPELYECQQYPSNLANLGNWCIERRSKVRLVGFDEAKNSAPVQHLTALSELDLPPLEELYDIYDTKPLREIGSDLIRYLQHAENLASSVELAPHDMLSIARDLIYALNRAVNIIFQFCRNLTIPEDPHQKNLKDDGEAQTYNIDLQLERTRASEIAQRLYLIHIVSPGDSRLAIKGALLPSRRRTFKQLYDIGHIQSIARENAVALASILGIILQVAREQNYILGPPTRDDSTKLDRKSKDAVFANTLSHLERWLTNDMSDTNPTKSLSINVDHTLFDYRLNTRLPLLKLYWWLQIVKARRARQLPSWEGIRIVKQHV